MIFFSQVVIIINEKLTKPLYISYANAKFERVEVKEEMNDDILVDTKKKIIQISPKGFALNRIYIDKFIKYKYNAYFNIYISEMGSENLTKSHFKIMYVPTSAPLLEILFNKSKKNKSNNMLYTEFKNFRGKNSRDDIIYSDYNDFCLEQLEVTKCTICCNMKKLLNYELTDERLGKFGVYLNNEGRFINNNNLKDRP